MKRAEIGSSISLRNTPASRRSRSTPSRRLAPGTFSQQQAERLGTVREIVDTTGINDHVEFTAPQAEGEIAITRLNIESQRELAPVGTRAIFPTLGLWMQQEPVTFAASDANLHRYVSNAADATDPPDE
jgi:hypothetical protein